MDGSDGAAVHLHPPGNESNSDSLFDHPQANECPFTLFHHSAPPSQCLLAVLEGKENDPPLREIHENEGYDDDEGIAESGM